MGFNAILGKISFYWQYPFVRYALVVGVLIALCSSLLGVTLVLRRFSFIGDGLSHVAFGAMTIATVLKMTEKMPLIMGITIVSAVLLLRTGQNTKIKGDAMMAMISVGALAIGYLIMNLFSTAANLSGDVCSTLFGSTSILTLTKGEVWFCAAMSAIVVIVLAMNLVGSLLISALVIFPAVSAMCIFKNFRSVTICAAVLSVTCAAIGILVSVLAGTPVGSTIVAVQIVVFFVFRISGKLAGGRVA